MIKNKIFTIFIIILFLTPAAFAVNAGKAPDAYSFVAPAGPQVNLATGDLSIGVPLMTVPGKAISFPVTLSYSAGIRIEQEASWVGLGWSLSPGAITRDVASIPDDYSDDDSDGKGKVNWNQYYTQDGGLCEIGVMGGTSLFDRGSGYSGWTSQFYPAGTIEKANKIAGDFTNLMGGPDTSTSLSHIDMGCAGGISKALNENGLLYGFGCDHGDSASDCLTPDNWVVSGFGPSGKLTIEQDHRTSPNIDNHEINKRFHIYSPGANLESSQATSILGSLAGPNAKSLKSSTTDGLKNNDPVKVEFTTNGPHDTIDSFTITDKSGTKYYYGGTEETTLYYVNKDGKDGNENSPETDYVYRTISETAGADAKIIKSTQLHRYAYTWLLRRIEDINGNWVNFNYVKYNDHFRFRAPFGNPSGAAGNPSFHYSSAPAELIYQDNWKAEDYMTKKSSEGWMQLSYLDSIETDTHIAKFDVKERDDSAEYKYETDNPPSTSGYIGSGRMKRLDKIELKKKTSSGEKIVNFVTLKQDYSLQRGIPSNVNGGGKLTLKEINFAGENGKTANDGSDPLPYKFEYAYGNPAGTGHNPNWVGDPQDFVDYRYDFWGYYWPDGSKYNHLIMDRYWNEKYASQSKKTMAVIEYPDAWSLTKITWPNGGETKIDYEIDTYSHVGDVPTLFSQSSAGMWAALNGVGRNLFGDIYNQGELTDTISMPSNFIDDTRRTVGGVVGSWEREAKSKGYVEGTPQYELYVNKQALKYYLNQLDLPEHLFYTNRMLHYGGGIRVKSMTTNPKVPGGSSIPMSTHYTYNLNKPFNEFGTEFTSQIADQESKHKRIISEFRGQIVSVSQMVGDYLGPGYEGGATTTIYGELLSGVTSSGVLSKPTYNLMAINLPMQVIYRRVVEGITGNSPSSSGINGFIVHEFTTPYDKPFKRTDINTWGWGGAAEWDPYDTYEDTSAEWGLEKETKVYNNVNQFISSTTNEYETIQMRQAGWQEAIYGGNARWLIRRETITPTWVMLKSTTSMLDNVKTKQDFEYSNVNGMSTQVTTSGQSADTRVSATKYTFEDSKFSALTDKHILDKPYVIVAGDSSASNYLSPTSNGFGNKANKVVYDYYISPSCDNTESSADSGCAIGMLRSTTNIKAESTQDSPMVKIERYTKFGAPERTVDARGNFAEIVYNNDGNPVYGWDSLSWNSKSKPAWNNVYDDLGRVTKMCDANGACTEYQYDIYSRLKKIIRPGDSASSPSVEFKYDLSGVSSGKPSKKIAYTKINNGQKGELTEMFDGLARQIGIELKADGKYIVTETDYNNMGKVSNAYKPRYKGTSANLKVVSDYYHDPLSRMAKVTNFDGTDITSEYNNQGNFALTTVTDEEGNSVTTKKDYLGNVKEVRDADNSVTKFDYDVLGRLTKQTDALNHVSENTYNSLNQIKKTDHPDLGVNEMEYDKIGNLIAKTTPKGVTNYEYDETNRLTSVTYPDGNIFTYYYDTTEEIPEPITDCDNGFEKLCMVEVKDSVIDVVISKTAYNYDNRGRISTTVHEIGGKQYSITYAYDSADNIISLTNPTGIATFYTYDDANRLKTVKADLDKDETPEKDITEYEYNPTSTIDSITFGSNQIYTKYIYTIRDWLKTIATVNTDGNMGSFIPKLTSGNAIFNRHYDFDDVGNVIAMYDSFGKSNKLADFRYDKLYRLTDVTDNDYYKTNIVFTYDKVGNRQTMETNKGTSTYNYKYESEPSTHSIKLSSVTGASTIDFDYDETGNTIQKNNMTLSYDAENRLICADDDYMYAYDSNGKRVKKVQLAEDGNTVTSTYIYDAAGNLIYEEHADNIEGDDLLFAQKCIEVES